MNKKKLLTRQEARESLIYRGTTIKDWAAKHGVKECVVRSVLKNNYPCRTGESHKVAVLLRIKDGIIEE